MDVKALEARLRAALDAAREAGIPFARRAYGVIYLDGAWILDPGAKGLCAVGALALKEQPAANEIFADLDGKEVEAIEVGWDRGRVKAPALNRSIVLLGARLAREYVGPRRPRRAA